MAWTVTTEFTGKAGEQTLDLSTYYDAVSLNFTAVPDYLGHFGGNGSRKVYYNAGYCAPAVQGGLASAPQRIRYSDQIIAPDAGRTNRVFLYLTPGLTVTVNGINWT